MIELSIALIFHPLEMGFYAGLYSLRGQEEYDTDSLILKLWIIMFQLTLYRNVK